MLLNILGGMQENDAAPGDRSHNTGENQQLPAEFWNLPAAIELPAGETNAPIDLNLDINPDLLTKMLGNNYETKIDTCEIDLKHIKELLMYYSEPNNKTWGKGEINLKNFYSPGQGITSVNNLRANAAHLNNTLLSRQNNTADGQQLDAKPAVKNRQNGFNPEQTNLNQTAKTEFITRAAAMQNELYNKNEAQLQTTGTLNNIMLKQPVRSEIPTGISGIKSTSQSPGFETVNTPSRQVANPELNAVNDIRPAQQTSRQPIEITLHQDKTAFTEKPLSTPGLAVAPAKEINNGEKDNLITRLVQLQPGRDAAILAPQQGNANNSMPQAVQLAARLAPVIQQAASNAQGSTTLRLKLKPEHLGEVTVRLVYNQGNLQAHFIAASAHTRELLDQSMVQLKENLLQLNINLNDSSTSSGDDSSRWAQQESWSQKQQQIHKDDFSVLTPDEILPEQAAADTAAAEQNNQKLNHLV